MTYIQCLPWGYCLPSGFAEIAPQFIRFWFSVSSSYSIWFKRGKKTGKIKKEIIFVLTPSLHWLFKVYHIHSILYQIKRQYLLNNKYNLSLYLHLTYPLLKDIVCLAKNNEKGINDAIDIEDLDILTKNLKARTAIDSNVGSSYMNQNIYMLAMERIFFSSLYLIGIIKLSLLYLFKNFILVLF